MSIYAAAWGTWQFAASRDEAVLHLRNEDKLFVFINAHEQRIEHVRPGDVTANDKLLLSVNAVLDPCA